MRHQRWDGWLGGRNGGLRYRWDGHETKCRVDGRLRRVLAFPFIQTGAAVGFPRRYGRHHNREAERWRLDRRIGRESGRSVQACGVGSRDRERRIRRPLFRVGLAYRDILPGFRRRLAWE